MLSGFLDHTRVALDRRVPGIVTCPPTEGPLAALTGGGSGADDWRKGQDGATPALDRLRAFRPFANGVPRLCRAFAAAIMTIAAAWACVPDAVAPAQAQIVEGAPVHRFVLTLNKSKTLKFECRFTSAIIGSPDIADLRPMTDQTLYVQGKKVGTTNISVFDKDQRLCAVVDLEVALDAGSLHNRIIASTGGQAINVTSTNGQVVLSGTASDSVSAARAVDVAQGLTGKDTPVVNAMKVAPSQQVMLKVRFLEVDRNAGRDLGVNWFGGNSHGIGTSGLGTVSNVTGAATTSCSSGTCATSAAQNAIGAGSGIGGAITGGLANTLFSNVFTGSAAGSIPFGALLAQVVNINGLKIDTMISALEDKGLVKTLAEPDLIALSGQQANFFAGGQIPIPTVQPGSTGTVPTVSVQYQNCGVQLNFVPTVLSSGVINVQLAPQVCEVSTSANSVTVNGTVIPELTTRSANTTVELRDGQSFAIAGLLQAQSEDNIAQLPWLGSMPVLGALFRSTNYQKNETDLVVIVTPRLVKPVPPGKHLATPFDTTLTANDIDLFLMGDTERVKKYTQFVTSGGDLQGPYGHILEAR